ncbi:MAG: glycoside hydrolase family 2 TIM barrel-domain containing protein [Dyadobacter sp.]|uniref:glycoside hydrolase family 2 TIM barrel-domain containing protein n=1 Tax=Dyadobacter sp. TaxID=1914288 RepID=UPI00326423DC
MKRYIFIIGIIAFGLVTNSFGKDLSKPIVPGRMISFDADWKFKKGKDLDAKGFDFNDANWRKLDVPHDWSIEDLTNSPSDSTIGPFYKGAIGKNATAFTVGGTAWYRKSFVLDKSAFGKNVFIQFDGVYMNADVWINGHHLGNHPSGYTSFSYDLTQFLNPADKPNVIAVRVKNEGDNSRWYTGSGIYRHVWLSVVSPAHIQNWGVNIISDKVSKQSAEIHVTTDFVGLKTGTPYLVTTELYSRDGKLIATQNSEITSVSQIQQKITVKNPDLWDLDHPVLYKAKIILKQNGKKVDEYTQAFGIRSINFGAKTGFLLNGQSLKIKGGCVHHDNGPLGAAVIDRAEIRKVQLLKKNGYNAVRLAHNPFSPQFLDACDSIGILVMNEAFDMWNKTKTPDDYALYFKEWGVRDLESIVIRDRNHPSIIMWSIGNEIPEIVDSLGYKTSALLANTVRKLDSTRAVTNAVPFYLAMAKGKNWNMTAPAFASLDVSGYNYTMGKYEDDHKKYPDRIMVATEYFPPKALENWNAVEKNDYVIGTFSWAAIDYLGEAGIGLARLKPVDEKPGGFVEAFMSPQWPIFNSYTGELDLIGNKKSASYYLDVVWRRSLIETMVHRPIPKGMKDMPGFYGFPDELKCWTWPGHENDSLEIRVFTRSPKVKLELNGKVIAEQTVQEGSIIATFKIAYTPGKLVARCYEGEKEIASEILSTTGKPAAIRLKAERGATKASQNDLAYIAVEIVDEAGQVVPSSDDFLVKYQISGNGVLAGVGNGNPKDMSSFQKPEKKVFQGRGLLIVRPTKVAGEIVIRAEVEGLKVGEVRIKTY